MSLCFSTFEIVGFFAFPLSPFLSFLLQLVLGLLVVNKLPGKHH